MNPCTFVMAHSSKATRLLLMRGQDQILKAQLPSPRHASPPRLCEALAQWLGQPLAVVLSVAELSDLSAYELDDGFGIGVSTESYAVRVHRRGRRQYGQRLRGFGDFTELTRLARGAR